MDLTQLDSMEACTYFTKTVTMAATTITETIHSIGKKRDKAKKEREGGGMTIPTFTIHISKD